MVDRIDPAGRLREIGRSDTPPLDGDRLARIEARVLATVAEPLVPQPSVAGIDSRRRFAPMIAIAAALLMLALLGVVALAARGGEGGPGDRGGRGCGDRRAGRRARSGVVGRPAP